jgi:1-acyl-sn-glycerol-3-phosphate acyltransferase
MLFQTFPFPQGTAYRPSLEYTGELLDRGISVLVFPEGEVSRSPGPGKLGSTFKTGIAKIADLSEAPVLPAGIKWERREDRRFPRLRPWVTVSFGPPLRYCGEGYGEFARKVEAEVGELVR